MKAYLVSPSGDNDDEYYLSEEKAQLRAIEFNELESEHNDERDKIFGGDHTAVVYEIEIIE
jgi:hypothetical protein